MNAFAQAFGPKSQAKGVIEDIPVKKSSVQEDMMMRLLKGMMPDFDPNMITNLGQKVEALVLHYNKELADLKSGQEEILRLLRERVNDGR